MKSLFISHASEDKDTLVRPLAESLSSSYRVWYDEYSLVAGMSLFEEINKGLNECNYGIVVLSPSFFCKKWTQQELNGLFSLETKSKKIILPIWKDITASDVMSYSPILSDRKAINAQIGTTRIVEEINRSIEFFEHGLSAENRSKVSEIRNGLLKKKEETRALQLLRDPKMVEPVLKEGGAVISELSDQLNSILLQADELGIRVVGPQSSNLGMSLGIWIGNTCIRTEYFNQIINTIEEARIKFTVEHQIYNDWREFQCSQFVIKDEFSPYLTLDDQILWKSADNIPLNRGTIVAHLLQKHVDALKSF